MSGMFLGGDYAFYPYDYLIGEIGNNLSTPDLSVTGFRNIVIGYYTGDIHGYTPQIMEGAFNYFGLTAEGGIPGFKAQLGINFQYSYNVDWEIFEIGFNASLGINYLLPFSIQSRSNLLNELHTGEKYTGTGVWLLNRNVIPTKERSMINLFSAPFMYPGLR